MAIWKWKSARWSSWDEWYNFPFLNSLKFDSSIKQKILPIFFFFYLFLFLIVVSLLGFLQDFIDNYFVQCSNIWWTVLRIQKRKIFRTQFLYTEFTLIIWCNIISFQAFQHDITANEAIRAFTSITAVKAIMVIQVIIVMAVMTVNSLILFSLFSLNLYET